MKQLALTLTILLASASVTALNTSRATAQDMSQGADNFYKSDRVTMRK